METESKTSKLKKKRKIFGWVFVASIFVFLAASKSLPRKSASISGVPPLLGHTSKSSTPDTAVIVSVVSLLK